MLITKDFVFVHIPKTGGTYVTKVLKELFRPAWMPRDLFRRLSNRRVGNYCIHFRSDDTYPNLGTYPYGQHCGIRHIEDSDRTILHVKRDPEDFYKSLFYYAWYKNHPHLEFTQLERCFENFPELKANEVFGYYQLLTQKIFDREKLNFGYLTYHIVDLLSPTTPFRDSLLKLIQNEQIDEAVTKLKCIPNMQILNLQSLTHDLMDYLSKNYKISDGDLSKLLSAPKLNVSKKPKRSGVDFLNNEQKQLEEFAYKFWDFKI